MAGVMDPVHPGSDNENLEHLVYSRRHVEIAVMNDNDREHQEIIKSHLPELKREERNQHETEDGRQGDLARVKAGSNPAPDRCDAPGEASKAREWSDWPGARGTSRNR